MKVSSFNLLLLLSLCCMRIYAVQLVSVYPQRPDDREAFYFTPENYGIRADGRTDVSDALQSAINQVKKESGYDNLKVVATGGLGRIISDETDAIQIYNRDLTLEGLRIIYEKNRQKK